jgi:hypothetical protein
MRASHTPIPRRGEKIERRGHLFGNGNDKALTGNRTVLESWQSPPHFGEISAELHVARRVRLRLWAALIRPNGNSNHGFRATIRGKRVWGT